jgi:hypothetical protein
VVAVVVVVAPVAGPRVAVETSSATRRVNFKNPRNRRRLHSSAVVTLIVETVA